FEKNFNYKEARQWMQENWHKSFFLAAAYVILIFGIQHFMKERRGYELRSPLALWSLGLALFSAMGAHRIWKQTSFILSTKGFKQSVCSLSFYAHPVSKLWIYLFALSKLLELGDTVFIVLRKKKLIFLHWYHHATTLVLSWYAYKEMASGSGWLPVLNYSIHAVMYSYYALRAAGFQVSRYIAMAITISQMLQIVLYLIMTILVFFWKEDKVCYTNGKIILLSFVTYTSFLVLFGNYFFKTYFRRAQKSKGE
ncbi:ELOV6 protein, partial [Corythaeola cristata]|nr:ELOV6 protein [Corythaeola cristata]